MPLASIRRPGSGPTGPLPAPVLVIAAVLSVQFGGALAVTLLPLVGVVGSVTLRFALAASVLCLLARPRVVGRTRDDWATVGAFAATLAAMNLAFYASLERLPIGVAVTIEFLGPLTLAALTSRRVRDLLATAAALLGVLLISQALTVPWSELDLVGIGLAAIAGICWAGYILLSRRTGARFAGLDGLAISMTLGSLVLLPIGIALVGSPLWSGEALAKGIGIAVLSSALPYGLELVALRRMAPGVFGVLLSLEPAAAALAGLLVLSQRLAPVQLAGMALVVTASILVLGRSGKQPVPDG